MGGPASIRGVFCLDNNHLKSGSATKEAENDVDASCFCKRMMREKRSVLFHTSRSDRKILDRVLRRKVIRGHCAYVAELAAWLTVTRCVESYHVPCERNELVQVQNVDALDPAAAV